MRPPIPPAQLLVEVDDVLRTMPDPAQMQFLVPAEWLGRAAAVVAAWDTIQGTNFDSAVRSFQGNPPGSVVRVGAMSTMSLILNRARHDLMLRLPDAGTKAVAKGQRFDYFDEVRKNIERARSDLLIVDAYMGAEFVGRYLPFVHDGVTVRLLAREKMGQLLPAVQMMREQRPGLQIEVRSAGSFHDRWLFLDGREAFHSGASFQDGALKAPTTLTPVLDAFAVMKQTYEGLWDGGTVK